jgi:hypothetical protein
MRLYVAGSCGSDGAERFQWLPIFLTMLITQLARSFPVAIISILCSQRK